MSNRNWKDLLRRDAVNRVSPPEWRRPTGSEYRVVDREQFLPLPKPSAAIWKFGAVAIAVMVLLTALGVGAANLLPASGGPEAGDGGSMAESLAEGTAESLVESHAITSAWPDSTFLWTTTQGESTTTWTDAPDQPTVTATALPGGKTTGAPPSRETDPPEATDTETAPTTQATTQAQENDALGKIVDGVYTSRQGDFRLRLPEGWTVYDAYEENKFRPWESKHVYELRAPDYTKTKTRMTFEWGHWSKMDPDTEDILMYNYLSSRLDVMEMGLTTAHTEINGLQAWTGKYGSDKGDGLACWYDWNRGDGDALEILFVTNELTDARLQEFYDSVNSLEKLQ